MYILLILITLMIIIPISTIILAQVDWGSLLVCLTILTFIGIAYKVYSLSGIVYFLALIVVAVAILWNKVIQDAKAYNLKQSLLKQRTIDSIEE